jgi:hypothetical protein
MIKWETSVHLILSGVTMKLVILVSALALCGASSASASDQFGEICTGTETVQVGTQAPKSVPYTLTFSADLRAGSYCYDKCGSDQTYIVSNSSSDPVKLADLSSGGQERMLTFDRRNAVLTDYQSFDAGLGRIVRKASAQCRPAAFHQPATVSVGKP